MSRPFINLAGQTFADLTAIARVGSSNSGAVWLWQCVCGKQVEYSAHVVKKGHTLSCGCRRSRDCHKTKSCRHCGKASLRKNRHGNPCSVCQKCHNKQTNGFKYRNPVVWMLLTAKMRAKKQNLPFDIRHEDIVVPEFCPVLGMRLKQGTVKDHDDAPSLDKLIPELGYVKGNVSVISWKANRLKSNATCEEIQKLAVWLAAQSPLPIAA